MVPPTNGKKDMMKLVSLQRVDRAIRHS